MSDPVRDAPDGPGLVEALWRHRRMVVVVTVLAAIAGFLLASIGSANYQATAQIVLKSPVSFTPDDGIARRFPERHLLNEAKRLTSQPVLAAAADTLDVSVGALRRSITVNPSPDFDLITVRASAPQPALAAERANAVVIAYEEVSAESARQQVETATEQLARVRTAIEDQLQVLEAAIAANGPQIGLLAQQQAAVERLAEIETEAQRLDVTVSVFGSGIEFVEPASPPGAPDGLTPTRAGVMGGALGLMMAGAVAWWRAGNRDVAESGEEPGWVLGAPLLARVPVPDTHRSLNPFRTGSEPFVITDPTVARTAGEAYHFLATSLEAAVDSSLDSVLPTSILVTSAAKGEGKTITAYNTALAAASDGRRVIVIDGGGRTPGAGRRSTTLTDLADLNGRAGLSDLVAEGGKDVDECLHRLEDPSLKVWVIPRGSSAELPPGFYRLPAFWKAMIQVKERADMVIVDSPPALSVSDAAALANRVDGVVLVVSRRTPLDQLEAVRRQLEMSGAPLLGYVFNRAEPRVS